ncbi:MAG: hypothetical protein IPO58_21465 [Betaproteobacteria bacterium]|nr:hypothetical protein [Betaproteobacteria bacterium]
MLPPPGDDAYATPIFAAAIGATTAAVPARTVAAGLGSANANFVAGKTYAEVLQRLVNTVAWGQSDGPNHFGWIYDLNDSNSADGSTLGWALLGLEIAQAAGATIPAELKTRLATMLTAALNTDGTLDYFADGNPASDNSVNVAKTGTALQGLAFTGAPPTDPRVVAAVAYITRNWSAEVNAQSFKCGAGTPTTWNKGCGYGMFNTFKGLRLNGIQTLPGIGRAAGPGPIPADDWYADYVDNLVANQNNPTSATGGEWSETAANPMGWSCCESDTTGITALAELILATTAFVQPTTLTLAPATGTGPVGTTPSSPPPRRLLADLPRLALL